MTTKREFNAKAANLIKRLYDDTGIYSLGVLRPFKENGKSLITIETPCGFTTLDSYYPATRTRAEWCELDCAVMKVFQSTAKVTCALMKNHRVDIPTTQALGTIIFSHDARDSKVQRSATPLPICHTTIEQGMVDLAGWHIANAIERMVLGQPYGPTFVSMDGIEPGSGKTIGKAHYVYGLTNTPHRTTLCHEPTDHPDVIFERMVKAAYDLKFYSDGPGTRIGKTWPKDTVVPDSLKDVVTTDKLPKGTFVYVPNTSLVKIIDGIPPTAIEWDGEMRIMAIMVPHFMFDFEDRTPVFHSSEA